MRLLSIALASLAFVRATSAQYFSEGWKPGKPVTQAKTGFSYQPAPTQTAGTPDPASHSVKKSFFDLSTYLEAEPMKALFGRAGVNITEKLEAARREADNLWNSKIPLLTDDNYSNIVLEEKFNSLEEERDRLWFIVITVSSAERDGISKFVDEQFDKAFNLTEEANDLPHVRWGRIDYMNVTTITTKWSVWRAPYLVVLKDKGQTLRFYRPGQIRLNPEILREFLKQDAWEQTKPWKSAFAPGGSREFVLDYLAVALTKLYNLTVMIPRWLLVVITGSFASIIVNLLHSWGSVSGASKSSGQPVKAVPATEQPATGANPVPASPSITKSSKSSLSKRKGGKK